MITKNQLKIMQLFTSKLTELFSLRSIGRILNMNVSLVHYALNGLKEKKLLILNKQNFLSLNYKKNHEVLIYVEYMRRNEFLAKPKNKDLAMFFEEFINRFKEKTFVLLIFGSAVLLDKPNDIDILLIVDNIKKTESSEKFLLNVAGDYGLEERLHVTAISYESVYEMLSKRENLNVMNELLNKHLLIYGAELFYRLLKEGR
jgi:hypothetical protein